MIWWWFWEPTLLASITVSHWERKGRSDTILIPVPSNTWNQNKWLWTVCHMWWVRSKLLFLLFFLKSPSRLWKCPDTCSASSSWTKPRQHEFWTRGKCYWSMSRHDTKSFGPEFELCVLINLAGFPSSNLFSQLCHPFPSYLKTENLNFFDNVFDFTLFLLPSRSTDLSVAESAHSESGWSFELWSFSGTIYRFQTFFINNFNLNLPVL